MQQIFIGFSREKPFIEFKGEQMKAKISTFSENFQQIELSDCYCRN